MIITIFDIQCVPPESYVGFKTPQTNSVWETQAGLETQLSINIVVT